MGGDAVGLIVHRGSRVERLAAHLASWLEAELPDNPLAAQTVVVAHAGFRRWLLGEFSRRSAPDGGHGIAANYNVILPWQWLEQVARGVLGDEALVGGPYRAEVLRWRILALLPELDSPQVATYLAGVDAARRSFQLAEHLAGVFAQYLIYRPDWIADWELGSASADDWQATLWRKLRAAIDRPHRAQRGPTLVEALAGGAGGAGAPLHVFGISHLPPDILTALRAFALHRRVHLYFPDPCREHWSYLRRRRDLLKQDGDAQALYFEVGHPLLVALGRIAQDFCLALDEIEATEDRDSLDEDANPESGLASAGLLAALQSSIRYLQPELVGATWREQDADVDRSLDALREDASLRVHACHTRLRELEVLKDALLRSLADDPQLEHRDIVVMAPDIGAYAPYLRAVFGEPAKYDSDCLHIPWHLADIGLASTHPLMSAFERVLDLGHSRFTVSEVMDFLDVPALARRFAIDADGRAALEQWLQSAHVAWGLDAAMKEQAGAAAVDTHSWQFGLDRMYAGLIVGQDPTQPLLDGILPLDGVGGSAVEALGQLDHLLAQLRETRVQLDTPRELAAWSQWLLERVDALFLADPRGDEAESAALDALRRAIAGLARQASDAGLHTGQPWGVVREVLRAALQEIPERQAFLLGGVTFCGLVPQRSIPFRMVCLIGMNEGEFPRVSADAGLNRMLTQPRRGDRDTRNEDRYLFLEALMAARERLHVSYLGVGVRDGKPRNPASPLAELLHFLDEQYDLAGDENTPRPWHLVHPLQPFDARYYERDAQHRPLHDPRLFSYDRTYLVQAEADAADGDRFVQFATATGRASADPDIAGELSLATLHRFWRDPAQDQLLRGSGLSLEALDENVWPDREPLEPKVSPLERLARRLLFDGLVTGRALSEMPPDWLALSGLLADGAIGLSAYADARDAASATLGAARAKVPGTLERCAQAIDLDLGDGVRLVGKIDRVFAAADGQLLLFDAKPNGATGFRELLSFYLDWAALRLSLGRGVDAGFVECTKDSKGRYNASTPSLLDPILAQDDDQLRSGLRRLIDAFVAARNEPLLFFPKAGWAYASSEEDVRIAKARASWEGSGFAMGEVDYSPGYAALLTRGMALFDEGSREFSNFATAVQRVADVLDPEQAVLFRPTATKRDAGSAGADVFVVTGVPA